MRDVSVGIVILDTTVVHTPRFSTWFYSSSESYKFFFSNFFDPGPKLDPGVDLATGMRNTQLDEKQWNQRPNTVLTLIRQHASTTPETSPRERGGRPIGFVPWRVLTHVHTLTRRDGFLRSWHSIVVSGVTGSFLPPLWSPISWTASSGTVVSKCFRTKFSQLNDRTVRLLILTRYLHFWIQEDYRNNLLFSVTFSEKKRIVIINIIFLQTYNYWQSKSTKKQNLNSFFILNSLKPFNLLINLF